VSAEEGGKRWLANERGKGVCSSAKEGGEGVSCKNQILLEGPENWLVKFFEEPEKKRALVVNLQENGRKRGKSVQTQGVRSKVTRIWRRTYHGHS